MYTKFKHEKQISDLPSTMSLALPICYHPSFSLLFIALCAVGVCVAKGGKLQFIYASLLIERFSWAKYSPRKSIETSSKRFGAK